MSCPEISVVMSVYNGERYLAEALQSILTQTLSDFEVIIVDDGSTDRTWKLLEDFASRDRRVLLLRNIENLGISASLNRAIAMARAPLIARQDADDISLPNRLDLQTRFMKNYPDVVLLGSWVKTTDACGVETGSLSDFGCELAKWYLLFFNYFGAHGSLVLRRSTFEEVGGYDTSFRYAQDYDLWTRLSFEGRFELIREYLYCFRRHSGSVSSCCRDEQLGYVFDISRRFVERLLDRKVDTAVLQDVTSLFHGSDADCSAQARSLVRELYDASVKLQSEFGAEENQRMLRREIANAFLRRTACDRGLERTVTTLMLVAAASEWSASAVARWGWARLRRCLSDYG